MNDRGLLIVKADNGLLWRQVAWLAAFATFGAGAAHAQEASQSSDQTSEMVLPALTVSDLLNGTEKVRAFRPKDDFDAAPGVPWVGRRFVVRQPMRKWTGNNCYGVPTWKYWPEDRTLELDWSGKYFPGGFDFKNHSGNLVWPVSSSGHQNIVLACAEKEHGAYGVVNAFGARSSIIRKSVVTTEIASHHSGYQKSFLLTSIPLGPDEARAITPHLQVEAEGVLMGWDANNVLVCGIDHGTPDFDDVYDERTDACIYKARIMRFAVIDTLNNRVLGEKVFDEAK